MKLTVLDGYAANHDEIMPWNAFAEFGEYEVFDRTPRELVVERAKESELLLTNKTVLDAELIASLPKLRYIGVLATGWNVVDTVAAWRAGVVVANVPAYSTQSVAQLVFAHILNLCRAVETHARSDWSRAEDFSYSLTPQIELTGQTLGIVGFGDIGRAVAGAALAFGMNVVVSTRTPSKIDLPQVRAVSMEELLRTADVVSLHCPLTKENAGLMDRAAFAAMKRTAIFINTARGGLVDESALAEALRSGEIRAAGLDVLCREPPSPENPLLNLPNCRISPHIAWASESARRRLMKCAVENIRAFLNGVPMNVVNGKD